MHEVGIMESALDAILAQARAHDAHRIHRVGLRVGALAGVDAEALQFAFVAVSKGTPAAGAALDIDTVPARGYCADCDLEFGVESGFVFSCPRCGRISDHLSQGRELDLVHLEMS